MKTKVPEACNDAERTQTLDQFQRQRHFAPTLLTGQREESSSPVESAINEVSVTLLVSNMARPSIGNKSHADTCQPSTVGFQILINSERKGRTHRPPNTLHSRHEWPTGSDADPHRCNTEGKLNTASKQATTPEDLKQYRNSHLASKRRREPR